MHSTKISFFKILGLFSFLGQMVFAQNKSVNIVSSISNQPRIQFGIEKLKKSLQVAGYKINDSDKIAVNSIVIEQELNTKKESFTIQRLPSKTCYITGADASGILYGCLELAEIIDQQKKLPQSLNITDAPEMVLRGTCIGLQKPYYLPNREVYEYPYTPETFPWFYDKSLWIKYLDMMVENRYNSLYLWNGHPFASLVKLKEYPYAVEVDEVTFKKNEEIFRFLTQEADKRGIWVIQMFYNIIVSKPFAEHHNIKTQDRNRPIVPLIADYTRKSIAAFVEKYPNVGLLVTLGEAMEGVGQDDVDWFTQTIIPGVKDGLKAINATTEPPIVLRGHDTDAPRVMKAALPIYKNLYTEAKYNGEALTTYTPRGKWADLHRTLSRIGTVHIQNVHILANLEPFRYASPDFIQKSVQAMHNVYEANGLHLYPQASYWDWPYSADKIAHKVGQESKRLLQIDRDVLWYKTWARYAWKANRERMSEVDFWSKTMAKNYGLSANDGKNILEAYEQMGEISPKLLRRYGITDGNRQTLTLGMLMTQLVNPYRYGLYTLMYDCEAPEGEKIIEYAEKEWNNQPHIGETPIQVANEVILHGQKAIEAIEKVKPKTNKEEFFRLRNDVFCHDALANFYAAKARAAVAVLRYKYSNNVADLELALPLLKQSVEHFEKLTALTKNTYWYANSMQTQQRKIPMRGVNATYKEWHEMLPVYQRELTTFSRKIDSLKNNLQQKQREIVYLKPANVVFQGIDIQYFNVEKGSQVFSDTAATISGVAAELKNLKGLKLAKNSQQQERTTLTFTCHEPVKLLVGFFNEKSPKYLPTPELEIDASANNYGQAESKITNGILINGFPAANIHSYTFEAGTHTFTLSKGACLLLGFIDGRQQIPVFDAGLAGNKKNIDWLFE